MIRQQHDLRILSETILPSNLLHILKRYSAQSATSVKGYINTGASDYIYEFIAF